MENPLSHASRAGSPCRGKASLLTNDVRELQRAAKREQNADSQSGTPTFQSRINEGLRKWGIFV